MRDCSIGTGGGAPHPRGSTVRTAGRGVLGALGDRLISGIMTRGGESREGDPEMTKTTNPTAAEFAGLLAELKLAERACSNARAVMRRRPQASV